MAKPHSAGTNQFFPEEEAMELSPQRASIVLEHASATTDLDDGSDDNNNSWSVVAYFVFDGGGRSRMTLYQYKTRAEASAALSTIWSDLTGRKRFLAGAA